MQKGGRNTRTRTNKGRRAEQNQTDTNGHLQYTAAVKTQTLDNTAKALENLSAIFKSDPKLQQILSAPTLSASDKSQIVAEIQKKLGVSDKEGTIKHFLDTLAENNRLSVLEGVAEKFTTLMSAYRGEVELTVISAAVRLTFVIWRPKERRGRTDKTTAS